MKRFLKNIKLFFFYIKTIKENKKELESLFNIRIDRAYRLYTVLNIKDELIDINYIFDTKYLEYVADKQITEFMKKLSSYLNSKRLNELYSYYGKIERVSKFGYLITIGFSLFQSHKFIKKSIIISSILTLLIILRIIFKL